MEKKRRGETDLQNFGWSELSSKLPLKRFSHVDIEKRACDTDVGDCGNKDFRQGIRAFNKPPDSLKGMNKKVDRGPNRGTMSEIEYSFSHRIRTSNTGILFIFVVKLSRRAGFRRNKNEKTITRRPKYAAPERILRVCDERYSELMRLVIRTNHRSKDQSFHSHLGRARARGG
jgi:hypothetical protein